MRYTKRPVTIEAYQFYYNKYDPNLFPDWLQKAHNIEANTPGAFYKENDTWKIFTLEGAHTVTDGDFIIKGVNGELYPCKLDIFAKTYMTEQEFDVSNTGGETVWIVYGESEVIKGRTYWEVVHNFFSPRKITCYFDVPYPNQLGPKKAFPENSIYRKQSEAQKRVRDHLKIEFLEAQRKADDIRVKRDEAFKEYEKLVAEDK